MNAALTLPVWLAALFVFLFGLALGSFLNVVIYRVPRGKSVVHPGSACPNCGAAVKPYDNVPVLSWLILRGRCRNCKAPIAKRYMVVELLTAVLFVLCFFHRHAFYWLFPATALDILSSALWSAALFKCWTFSFLLLGLIFIDAELQLLPDKLTIPGIVLGFVFSYFIFVPGIPEGLLLADSPVPTWLLSFLNAGMGALLGGGFIYLAGEIYFRVRGIEGMGFGDVKLMAMIGAFLGWKLTLFTIFGASLLGSFAGIGALVLVYRRRLTRFRSRFPREIDPGGRAWNSARLLLTRFPIPFGVFLGSMALFAMFWGTPIIDWYARFYR